jgi:putative hydrolase of the HAD superfamily
MHVSVLFPVNWQQYEHIVLDFGGVLYEIDHQKTTRAFQALGFSNMDKEFRHGEQSVLFDRLERGELTDEEFLLALRNRCSSQTTIEQVRNAWNAMLLELRPEVPTWLHSLGGHFDLLLLSNTNAIHASYFEKNILQSRGRSFADAFRQIIYSHRMGRRKPDIATYQHVAEQFDLDPQKTLLIDDTKENVAGAIAAGWSAVHFDIESHSFRQFVLGVGYEDFLNA